MSLAGQRPWQHARTRQHFLWEGYHCLHVSMRHWSCFLSIDSNSIQKLLNCSFASMLPICATRTKTFDFLVANMLGNLPLVTWEPNCCLQVCNFLEVPRTTCSCLSPSSVFLLQNWELLMDPAVSITGIGWGISDGQYAGWLVSPMISELLDKCFSYIGFPSPDKVEEIQRKILQVKLMLEATTEDCPQRARLEQWMTVHRGQGCSNGWRSSKLLFMKLKTSLMLLIMTASKVMSLVKLWAEQSRFILNGYNWK